jgi:hypothetical protein
MHEAELLAIDIADALDLLPDIVLADRFHDLVERVEQTFRLQRRAGDRLAVRQFRRRPGGKRGHDLAFQISPGEPLSFNFDARILRLKTAGDVVERFDRLRLGLGVPDAHDLVLRESRSSEPDHQSDRERDHSRYVHECPPLNALISFKRRRAARPLCIWHPRPARPALRQQLTAASVSGQMSDHGRKRRKSCQSRLLHERQREMPECTMR